MNFTPRIQVVIRKRPLNEEEISSNKKDIIVCSEKNQIVVKELRTKLDCTKYIESHNYLFDRVFNEKNDNVEIY